MSEHLRYDNDKHDPAGRGSGNSRNATQSKKVLTEIGPVLRPWSVADPESAGVAILNDRTCQLPNVGATLNVYVLLSQHRPYGPC